MMKRMRDIQATRVRARDEAWMRERDDRSAIRFLAPRQTFFIPKLSFGARYLTDFAWRGRNERLKCQFLLIIRHLLNNTCQMLNTCWQIIPLKWCVFHGYRASGWAVWVHILKFSAPYPRLDPSSRKLVGTRERLWVTKSLEWVSNQNAGATCQIIVQTGLYHLPIHIWSMGIKWFLMIKFVNYASVNRVKRLKKIRLLYNTPLLPQNVKIVVVLTL